MAQQTRARPALPESPGSIPCSYTRLTATSNSSSEQLNILLASLAPSTNQVHDMRAC